jgi:hypothetical protein
MPTMKDVLKDIPDRLPILKSLPMGPKRIKLSQQDCQVLCGMAGITYMEGYEDRVLQYTITNETTDRYGDIVRAAGVDLTNYKREPVVHLAHDTSKFPVGNSIKTWYDSNDKSIKSWALFVDDRVDRTGLSETAFRFASNGHMKGASVGFLPTESNSPSSKEERDALGLGEQGREYRKCELLEYSICSIPCNPSALTTMSKKFEDTNALIKEMSKHNCNKCNCGGPDKCKNKPEIKIEEDVDMTKEELKAIIDESIAGVNKGMAEEVLAKLNAISTSLAECVTMLQRKKEEEEKPEDAPEEDGTGDSSKSFYLDVMKGISAFRKDI